MDDCTPRSLLPLIYNHGLRLGGGKKDVGMVRNFVIYTGYLSACACGVKVVSVLSGFKVSEVKKKLKVNLGNVNAGLACRCSKELLACVKKFSESQLMDHLCKVTF